MERNSELKNLLEKRSYLQAEMDYYRHCEPDLKRLQDTEKLMKNIQQKILNHYLKQKGAA